MNTAIKAAIAYVRMQLAGRSVDGIMKGFTKQRNALRTLGQYLIEDAQKCKVEAAELNARADAAIAEAARAAQAAAKLTSFIPS